MLILIPGGCGFIGSNLAIFLKQNIKNSVVISVDNLSRNTSILNQKRLKNHNINNIKLNLSSRNCLKRLKKIKKKISLIIDCCAEPSVELSKSNPNLIFNSNLLSTFNLLQIAKINKSKIIYFSTSRVYSIDKINNYFKKIKFNKILPKKLIIDEKFSTESPISLYGFSKLSSEILIKEYSFLYNMKYLINRFGVVSGYGQFGKQDQGFLSMWLWRHLNKLKINYQGFGGYGNQVRDVLDINDLCLLVKEQILKMNKIYNQTFNVGGGISNAINLKQLTNYCVTITNNKIKLNKNLKTSNYDIRYYITNNKKIYSTYDWRVKKNIKLIIKQTFESLIKFKKDLKKIL